MLIDKNIFFSTKNIHHKKPILQKKTLQVNKSKTKFDVSFLKFLKFLKFLAEAAAFAFFLLLNGLPLKVS